MAALREGIREGCALARGVSSLWGARAEGRWVSLSQFAYSACTMHVAVARGQGVQLPPDRNCIATL